MGDIVKMPQGQYNQADVGGTEILAFARYPDLEKAADRTAAKIKEGFMEMGYILKVARDTDILSGSGYMNHEEFAEKRYGLDKGTVSRYIRIVERFSVGGNSHVLQEGYKNIGFAKLSLMLHMPDAIAEEITESYSKQEVQAIKEEIDAERAVSDIEVAIEAAGVPEAEKTGSLLDKAVRQLGREQPALYRRLHEAFYVSRNITDALVMETLAPQGDAIYMVRISGTGRLMLSLSADSASVTNVRSGDKEKYGPEDVYSAVGNIMHHCSAEESWRQEYGEPMEAAGESLPGSEGRKPDEKEKVAPVQPKEKRRESKVVKAAPAKPPAKAPAKKSVKDPGMEAAPASAEEPLPGQMEVMDYPEAIPDAHFEEITEDVPGEALPEPEVFREKKPPGEEHGAKHEESPDAAGWIDIPEEEYPDAAGKASIPEEEDSDMAAGITGESSETAESGSSNIPACTETADDVRIEAEGHLDGLRKVFTVWNGEIPLDFLEKAHLDALGLAAAIEKLMDIERNRLKGYRDGKEHYAQ